MKLLFLLLATVFSMAGCSTSGVAIPIGSVSYPATSPDSVMILAEKPSQSHVAIALVDGTAATDDYFTQERTQAAALKAMREKAAALGAHAIVITNRGNRPYGGALWEKVQLSGTAIRYTDTSEPSVSP